jgi:hypothetical protein
VLEASLRIRGWVGDAERGTEDEAPGAVSGRMGEAEAESRAPEDAGRAVAETTASAVYGLMESVQSKERESGGRARPEEVPAGTTPASASAWAAACVCPWWGGGALWPAPAPGARRKRGSRASTVLGGYSYRAANGW